MAGGAARFLHIRGGSLGWGLPAAVGIALAERVSGRNRPVVAVIGDGSMQYSIASIANGYDCHAVTAQTEDDIHLALADAFGRRGPTVLVVPVTTKVPPLL